MSYPKKVEKNLFQEKALTNEEEAILEEVLKALRQIKFGYIQLTIQDSKVVQIEKAEKQRFQNSK